jgi:hypothetical protein
LDLPSAITVSRLAALAVVVVLVSGRLAPDLALPPTR